MRRALTLACLAVSLLVCATASAQNVNVTATAGTPAATYATLKGAFDAINAGTHQGAISIDIAVSTTEGTTPATLNSSGAGPALYTSVVIYPSADGVSVSGNPAQGFGVIQLKGADNVTIDGDNPGTPGINRDLTIQNTATAATTYGSVIRIANSTAVTSSDNITIQNCILLGNVTGGNASGATSTTGSSNASFGIFAGGNGGTTATDAPTAVTSVTSTTAPATTTINNLLIHNNWVNAAARAVVFNGASAAVSNGVTITANLVGDQGTPSPATPPYTSPATTVYTKGIWVAGTSAITVTGNTLTNLMSYVGTTISTIELNTAIGTSVTIGNNTITNPAQNGGTGAVKGILISSATGTYTVSENLITNVQAMSSSSGTAGIDVGGTPTSGTVELNKVTTVYNRNATTYGATGILLSAGTTVTLRNNFVSDVNMNMSGGGAFSTTFGVYGIKIAGGTLHRVYHNSVNLSGTLLGTAASSILTSAFAVVGTGQTGLDVRNNVFSNTLSGGTTSIAHVSVFLPSGGTSAMNLTLDNNGYYSGSDTARQGLAQVGTTAGTNFYLVSNFDPSATTPATNFRAYSSTLSLAGTNDSLSFAKNFGAPFTSATDLHIPAATVTQLESGGVGTGVTGVLADIDGDARPNGTAPDIGADEFTGVAPPANDIAATAIVVPANGSIVLNGASVTPQASFQNVGVAAQAGVGVQFTITGPGGYAYSDPQVIPAINPGQTVTVTFTAAPAFTTAGSYSTTAAVTTADANATNDQVTGSFQVKDPLAGGTYTVPGSFPSLTNPGGIFEELNAVGATGNIVIDIAADLAGETGAIALNQLAGGWTVTIKPTGAARTISGTSTGFAGLIKLNGADGVTIDGSLSGGTDRSLAITDGNANGTVIWIASASAADGALNTTVKNCVLSGAAGVRAIAGILSGSGTTLGNDAEASNSNITIQNNAIYRVQNSVYLRGNATTPDTGWLVTGNEFGSTVAADKNIFRGILVGNAQGFVVTDNVIRGVVSTSGSTSIMTGIFVGLAVNGGTIARNQISDIKHTNTLGYGSAGIYLGASTTASNLTIANNFISDVASYGWAGGVAANDNGYGIMIDAGGGYNIYHNSVLLNTNQTIAATTAALNIAAAVTTAGSIDLRDNVFASTQTNGTRYGVYDASTAGAAIFSTIDYNDYFAQNVGFLTSARATLAAWQTATGQDANSQAVDPLFVTATAPADLHLQGGSPMIATGTPIAAVTDDIDGDARDAATPDIGADEWVGADLSITKTDSPDPVVAGTDLTYTVTVTNAGPAAATNASWTDTLPAGTTFVDLPATGWTCTTPAVGSGGTVSCSFASFPSGFSTIFTLTVHVDGCVADSTVLSNTATVSTTTGDPNAGNDSATATTTVSSALPNPPLASSEATVCQGETIHLTTPTIAGATYAWTGPNSFNSATQNPTITNAQPADGGTFFVTVTLNGCTSAPGSTTTTVTADSTAPVVTPPSDVVVFQTLCCGTFGGADSDTSATLAAFLAGGTATDDCTATALTPQVGGVDVTGTTCFEVGTT
ncbi:DUF11 domain-containing protein, partial [Acidobacteria bacterium ACD]|nr:DUF11 domain-containing protein [Acidobacteria bacterium ACD]